MKTFARDMDSEAVAMELQQIEDDLMNEVNAGTYGIDDNKSPLKGKSPIRPAHKTVYG